MELSALAQIRLGHALMAACCALYLAWWAIFFWPKVQGGEATGTLRVVGVVAILGAVACGLIGATQVCGGSSAIVQGQGALAFALGSVALYAVMLLVTTKLFDRQPTTELVLFAAWLGMELFCSFALGSAGSGASAVALGILAGVGFAVSLVCYVLYYRLDPLPSFVDGCIPLALIGVISLLAALM